MIQELLNRADKRGFVTIEDVMEIIEDDGDEAVSLEAVLDELDELGIEFRQDDAGRDELEEVEDEFELDSEEMHDPIGDINAVSADDPVGLYFRQMAQEPLLTAQEEIELAKRIEQGKLSADQMLLKKRLDL
ncbi:partial RNA polymerase sigma factor SigA, partial [Anaerolineae bacterium]